MEASSQSKGPWLFNGGFTAGMTAAQVRGDRIDGFNKLGFHAGAVLDIRLFQNLGFQMGMVFNQKGSRKTQNINAGDFTTWAYRFTYVDVPLTLIYDFKDPIHRRRRHSTWGADFRDLKTGLSVAFQTALGSTLNCPYALGS